jgi:hypothetical protein
MHERILRQMRERIRLLQYVMTLHAYDEMEDDALSIFDVERAVLTGQIVERQEDRATGDWKYMVEGRSVAEEPVTVVARLSVTGKLVIITVYRT